MRRHMAKNLSPSVKTDISYSMFNMDTKLGACQSSHVLGSKAYFLSILLEVVSYASTRLWAQSRSIRFEVTLFFGNRTVQSAGGSVVKSIEAVSLLVSNHHIKHFAFSCVLSVSELMVEKSAPIVHRSLFRGQGSPPHLSSNFLKLSLAFSRLLSTIPSAEEVEEVPTPLERGPSAHLISCHLFPTSDRTCCDCR